MKQYFSILTPHMQIEKIYNKVAKTYNQDASGKVLDISKRRALELALSECGSLQSILALGMGDGTDLLPYKEHYPQAEFHGLDISENMLEKAKDILECKTYHGNITKASAIIEKRDFDFIIAHFVTAYVPLPDILSECKKLIAKNGLISILTNTMASFPVGQSLIPTLQKSSNPFDKLVACHVRKILKTVYVPQDLNHLQALIEANGFKVKATTEKDIALDFTTEKDVYDFLIDGGWFVSGLSFPLLPQNLLRKICGQLVHRHFPIPYKDTMNIAIAIAEPK